MPMNLATIESLWAFTVAIFAVGGCIGGLSNGFFADKLGRYNCLMFKYNIRIEINFNSILVKKV